jgi:hypothetical protein
LQSNQGNVVNINLNLSNPVQELNINSNGATFNTRLNDNSFVPAENSQTALPDDGYQPFNQTGFQQWKQMEQPQNQFSQNRFPQQHFQQQMSQPYQNTPYQQYPYQNAPYQMMLPSVGRRGDELIIHKMAMLPDTCVKCNEYIAGGAYSTQKYRWHNPLVYIALISPLIYMILALTLSHRGSVSVPLCHAHLQDKEKTGKTLLFSGIGAFVVIFLSFSLGFPGFGIFTMALALIGLVLGYEFMYKPLRVSSIENDYVHLKGAGNEYLSQFNQM